MELQNYENGICATQSVKHALVDSGDYTYGDVYDIPSEINHNSPMCACPVFENRECEVHFNDVYESKCTISVLPPAEVSNLINKPKLELKRKPLPLLGLRNLVVESSIVMLPVAPNLLTAPSSNFNNGESKLREYQSHPINVLSALDKIDKSTRIINHRAVNCTHSKPVRPLALNSIPDLNSTKFRTNLERFKSTMNSIS